MAYGLLSTGFVPKPYTAVLSDIEADFRASFGESIDLTPQSALGQIAGIIAERVSEVWDASQAVYNAFVPDSATGAALDALAAITGTLRLPATKSTVTLFCTGTAGTALAVGRQASVDDTEALFETTEAEVIVAATPWAINTAYVVGDVRSNGARIYRCTIAGTSAGAGGPSGTGTAITDNTVTWRYMGDGAGYVEVDAECTVTGVIAGLAYTVATIETPVSGWSNVTNVADAVPGRDIESDADLRLRREGDLQATGGGAVEQIREAVAAVEDVTEVTVYENATDATVDSIPPHAVEVLVLGGVADDLRAAIFAAVAAGIATYGTTSGTVVDSMGISHTVKFTRPTEVPIYFVVTLTKDPDEYPSDGDAQVKAAMKTYGDTFRTGWDVRSTAFVAQIFTIPGVLDVTACYLGTAPAPGTAATVVTTARQLATFATANIGVTASNGTP